MNALATFTLRWLIPRLSGFQVAHPSIEVRLTTSNLPLAQVGAPFDVAIRGGPDSRPGHSAQPFLTERRIPVCSPALLARLPLREPAQLRHHRSCTRRRCRGSGRTGSGRRGCRIWRRRPQ